MARKKILLTAPTGAGKTTFVLDEFLPYIVAQRGKLLILCNRRLLREQYWNDLICRFSRYSTLKQSVDLRTYQQLEQEIDSSTDIRCLFQEYSAIICDEAHFFYADCDFNGFGTYIVLQAIICAGFSKTMIFMSATLDESKPLIEQTIKSYREKLLSSDSPPDWVVECSQLIVRDFSYITDYSHVSCYCFPDYESLCIHFASLDTKSIVFIDNKKKASELKEKMLKTRKISANDITILNAENLDSDELLDDVRLLAIAHRVRPKILITTSVLDNGVSIKDADVKNVAIITDSEISFLQMLGRIRVESDIKINLFFVIRSASEFSGRVERLQKEVEFFENLDKVDFTNYAYKFMKIVWRNNEIDEAELCRKALVVTKRKHDYYLQDPRFAYGIIGDTKLSINRFAFEKCGNMLLSETTLKNLATENPLMVIHHQMSWIGKQPDELEVFESELKARIEKEMRAELIKVSNFDKKQMVEFKKNFACSFGSYLRNLFPNTNFKNQSFEDNKLKTICDFFDLAFISCAGSDGNKRYSIVAGGFDNE